MPLMNQHDRYGWLAIALHWLLFLLLLGLVASGKFAHDLPRGEQKSFIIGNHSQIGMVVFILMAFRLLWKLINPKVAAITQSLLLRAVANIVHWTLYLVVLAQAAIGVALVQARGREPALFDAIPVPPLADLFTFLPTSARTLGDWHHHGAHILIALVALHIAGAIFHRIHHRHMLKRMWFNYQPAGGDNILPPR